MADQNHQLSEEEVALMLKRAGVMLPSEQLHQFCAVVEKLEAAAHRVKKNLKRNDEPASAFIRR